MTNEQKLKKYLELKKQAGDIYKEAEELLKEIGYEKIEIEVDGESREFEIIKPEHQIVFYKTHALKSAKGRKI